MTSSRPGSWDAASGTTAGYIPASTLNRNRERALETFINGVKDIKIGIKAYSRQGN